MRHGPVLTLPGRQPYLARAPYRQCCCQAFLVQSRRGVFKTVTPGRSNVFPSGIVPARTICQAVVSRTGRTQNPSGWDCRHGISRQLARPSGYGPCGPHSPCRQQSGAGRPVAGDRVRSAPKAWLWSVRLPRSGSWGHKPRLRRPCPRRATEPDRPGLGPFASVAGASLRSFSQSWGGVAFETRTPRSGLLVTAAECRRQSGAEVAIANDAGRLLFIGSCGKQYRKMRLIRGGLTRRPAGS